MKSPSFMKSPRLLWWTPHLPFIPWRADTAAAEFMPHVPDNTLPSLFFIIIIPWFSRSERLPRCINTFFLCPVTQRDLPAGVWFCGCTSTGTHLGQWHDFLQAHTSWLCLFPEPGRSCESSRFICSTLHGNGRTGSCTELEMNADQSSLAQGWHLVKYILTSLEPLCSELGDLKGIFLPCINSSVLFYSNAFTLCPKLTKSADK